jgi:hypothetical protein
MPRKKGGQPGNTNALVSGMYSHRFTPIELSDLEVSLQHNLLDEIALVKVSIRRLFEYTDSKKKNPNLAKTLMDLSTASVKLATLLRTQSALAAHSTDVAILISSAIEKVFNEIKSDYPTRLA